MKKLFTIIFIITATIMPIFFAYKLQKVEALGKNDPGITSVVLKPTQDPTTKKWTWYFVLRTQNIGEGITIDARVYKDSVNNAPVGSDTPKTVDNGGAFNYSGLDNNTTYIATWKISTIYRSNTTGVYYTNLTATYECKTGNTSNCSAKINNALPVFPDDPTIVNAKAAVVFNNSNIYKMLAPIGGIERMDSSGTDPTCAADPKCITNDIGKYLNIIFKLAIGICAALAVIMLIINGVKYMGDESIFGKTEAKKNMFGAIVGLLIALGAWALLNTINPALTGQNGLNISSANVEINETPILSDKGSVAPTKNSFNDCPGGTRVVQTKIDDFRFCAAYATKLQQMVADADAAGYELSGGGFRPLQTQIALRNANCPDPKLTVPSSSCHPETALPGTSNHEQGLAVDLKCNGLLINLDNPNRTKNPSTKVCFDWLTKNAITYGFKNLPSENWHWSIGPKAGQ